MTGGPVVIAIEIGEPELADRLAAILSDVPGLRLAAPGEPADAALVASLERTPDPEVALTRISQTSSASGRRIRQKLFYQNDLSRFEEWPDANGV